MFRVKLKVGETRMIMTVDRNTGSKELLPIIQSRLSCTPGFQSTYFTYDKIEIECDDGLYQILDNGPISSYLSSNETLHISCSSPSPSVHLSHQSVSPQSYLSPLRQPPQPPQPPQPGQTTHSHQLHLQQDQSLSEAQHQAQKQSGAVTGAPAPPRAVSGAVGAAGAAGAGSVGATQTSLKQTLLGVVQARSPVYAAEIVEILMNQFAPQQLLKLMQDPVTLTQAITTAGTQVQHMKLKMLPPDQVLLQQRQQLQMHMFQQQRSQQMLQQQQHPQNAQNIQNAQNAPNAQNQPNQQFEWHTQQHAANGTIGTNGTNGMNGVSGTNINANGREEEKLPEMMNKNDDNAGKVIDANGNDLAVRTTGKGLTVKNEVASGPDDSKEVLPDVSYVSEVNAKHLASQSEMSRNYVYITTTQDAGTSGYIVAINFLIEYLPNNCLISVFDCCGFDCSPYLQHGWMMRTDVLNDYPILYIENVQNIYNQPSLIFTIGLPGSGKTTWARERFGVLHTAKQVALRPDARDVDSNYPLPVIAADDYFTLFNSDEFDKKLLQNAHEWCKTQVCQKLKKGDSVCVNNTHTTLSEMHAVASFAALANLPHKIVFAVMPAMQDIGLLARRNVHKVEMKHIKSMRDRLSRWYKKTKPSVRAVLKAGPFRGRPEPNICKKVGYTGVFIDGEDMKLLRQYFVSVSKCKALLSGVVHDGHVTLKFAPTWDEVLQLPFGAHVEVNIVGYVNHRLVQCFLVDLVGNDANETQRLRSLCKNKYAHITVAYDKDEAKPHYSNFVLDHANVVPILDVPNEDNICKFGGMRVRGICGAWCQQDGIYLETPEFVVQPPAKKPAVGGKWRSR